MSAPEPASMALVDRLRRLPADERKAIYSKLSNVELAALEFQWRRFWARPDQLEPPGDWRIWACLGGRGAGKTRTGGEWVLERVRNGAKWVHLVGATADDVTKIMLNGQSGLLSVASPEDRPLWFPSKDGGRLEWPKYGATGLVFTAEKPKGLRGPQCDTLWLDDVAAWGSKVKETWDMAMFGFRLGRPKCIVTTTDDDIDLLDELLKENRRGVVVTRAQVFANAGNVAPSFLDETLSEFEGTDLYDTQVLGLRPPQNKRSPFHGIDFATIRVASAPAFKRIVIAIDPSMSGAKRADEAGIGAMGLGYDDLLYVLEDLSGRHEAEDWGDIGIDAYDRWAADCIVGEVQRGNSLIRANVRAALARKRKNFNAEIQFKEVYCKRGKVIRWGPVRTLYAKNRMRHVGHHPLLERQMRDWNPENVNSPDDRIDWMVHAAYELAGLSDDAVDPGAGFEGLEQANAEIRAVARPHVAPGEMAEDVELREDEDDYGGGFRGGGALTIG